MTPEQQAALERLIGHVKHGTGQGRRVADFLLAWWNPGQCGAFDLTALWGLDDAIADDVVAVFAFIAKHQTYPDTLGYAKDFKAIISEWRPELVA